MTDLALPLRQARPASSLARLVDMLRTCRPHGSAAEQAFTARFLQPLGAEADGFGNLWLRIGDAPILWSSHVDTCHRRGGEQSIVVTQGLARLDPSTPSNCLGADCTAGVWLMTEMIRAGIAGLYAFHRGEERGGLGSRHVAQLEPHRLDGILAAIAFDRRGASSIITHQGRLRTCSDAFALSLADAIGLDHAPDPTGIFTDTANYAGLVCECTNVSVGYEDEHTPHETLDLTYLLRLRDALVAIDTRQLAFAREPGEPDPGDVRALQDIVRARPHLVARYLAEAGIRPEELEDFRDFEIPP
jgi:hypothetical protein